MATLTIDGRAVTVADATNLVDAAASAGIDIPTFCYHPGLTVVGQCRICFVEVAGLPRLVTACSTPVRDGMVVNTASDRVKEARTAVMEFLLANHPLDCPVCDQAGECYLQDHSVDHGVGTTHMVDTRRTFPGFERRHIGPHVVQNQNRCIHCTRCIRFCEEIAETGDLTMKSRGNHSYIDTFDGQPFANPWSACAADVCPVGALTVKEFRFRARVWKLTDTPSVCPGCGIGCNIDVGHLKGVVHRFLPRHNPEVNGWWMCDHGRFLAESLNERQVEQPMTRARSGPGRTHLEWPEALDRLRAHLETAGTRVVAAATLSNEALYLVKKLLLEHLGLAVVVPLASGEERRMKDGHGAWVATRSNLPNATGARLLGLPTVEQEALEDFLMTAAGPVVILDNLAHPWLAGDDAAQAVKNQPTVVVARLHTPMSRKAELVLPVASWIESEGTYTTVTGCVQLASRRLLPPSLARPVWQILALLGERMGVAAATSASVQGVFESLAAEVPAFAGMTYTKLAGAPGLPVLEETSDVG